ncbi:hypothetical protein XENTR_v10009687 [Xenopus tropicalis]|nr:hypothetical protein XENTR_v10009687 [Xenopus tropicalis]
MPLMAYLIDLTSVYGGVYAITDVALCLGFAIVQIFFARFGKNSANDFCCESMPGEKFCASLLLLTDTEAATKALAN